MTDAFRRSIYESPVTIALGPWLSAIAVGFAEIIGGRTCITPAGERYLSLNYVDGSLERLNNLPKSGRVIRA